VDEEPISLIVRSSALGRAPTLLVLDANVLLQDIRHMARTGERSILISASDEGVARLLAPASVVAKVQDRLPRLAYGAVGLDALDRVWPSAYDDDLWVVGVETDVDDPEVTRVLDADPEDASVMTLARIVAPALLLSMNHRHLPLATGEWLEATRAIRRLAVAERRLEGATHLVGGMALAPVAGIVGAFHLLRRMRPAWALGVAATTVLAAAAYFRTEHGWGTLQRVGRGIWAFWEKVAAGAESAERTRQASHAKVTASRIQPPETGGVTGLAARVLALKPRLSATEIVDALSLDGQAWTATRLRREVLEGHPMFVSHNRRWTLGKLVAHGLTPCAP
jgi:hypothetical protein